MKWIIFLTFFLCVNLSVFAQNEASNWYFGFNAGMQFNQDDGSVTVLNDGELSTNEGCASISDGFSNLLFYTDGSVIYDRNHNVMSNGTGLFGDSSSTQSAIIVPKPNNLDIFYVFTVDNGITNGNFGLNYSEVDMTLNGGLGAVTIKNSNLLGLCSEKITAVLKDCVTKSIWVITFASATGTGSLFNTYHAFEVSSNGVNSNSVASTFNISISEPRGYLKLSPDGTKLASANFGSGLFLYDFDVTTGMVSNPTTLSINTQSGKAYGIEFSPDSQYLYVCGSNDVISALPTAHFSTLAQFDTNATNIQTSQVILDQRQLYRGGLQLGPNGKIYRALSATYGQGLAFLGVINNPNSPGITANYQHNSVNLSPNLSAQGLPPFIQSIFNTQTDIIRDGVNTINLPLCTNDTYTLIADDIPSATYMWSLNGEPLPDTDFDIEINQGGHYEVFIDPNNGDCNVKGEAYVSYYEIPQAFQAENIIKCELTTTSTFDFTTVDSQILVTQDPEQFEVHYYTTAQDADTDTNEILGLFTNTSSPQEIFVRVDHVSNSNCYDLSSFMIEVFTTPVIMSLENLTYCDSDEDGNSMDGKITLNFNDFLPAILGNQNSDLYAITFHNSQLDADTGENELPMVYTNTSAYNEEVFVRIENNSNNNCYSTDSFILTVNDAPIANDVTIIQCDEDGISEGFTQFNINQKSDEISGGLANTVISYFLNPTDAINNQNAINGNTFSNFSNPQTVYAKVFNSVTGCFNTSAITLLVSTTSSNNATLEACDDDGMEDGFLNFDLTLASPSILDQLPTNLTVNYYENYSNALLEIDPLGEQFTNTIPNSQLIYARVENANDCFGISELQLKVYDLPQIETISEIYYCLNFFPSRITINGGVISDSPSNYYYLWSTGETTSEIMVNAPGNYNVRVTNTNGCYKDRVVTVLPSNIATISGIDIVDASENNSITIIVSGEGSYEYSLDYIDGFYQESNIFENVIAGLHTVYVRDRHECGITDQIISVVGFPKFFTPNNDGFNDQWQVYGISNQFQPKSKIHIFDRYGKFIVALDPIGQGWDGTFNGTPMPTSDYWFTVTLQDGRIFKGHFTLKR